VRHFYTVFFILIANLLSCSTDRIAGSIGGSETTNGVTACIYREDGTPASNSVVRLRRADYISQSASFVKKIPDRIDMLTDTHGRFAIMNIAPGDYCIEVNDTMTGGRQGSAVLLTCTLGINDTVDLGTDSLRPYAAVCGVVDMTVFSGSQLYAWVRGLERMVSIDTNGLFTFHDLPSASLDLQITDSSASGASREILNVNTVSLDTVKVKVYGTSSFSGYIYLNTAAAATPVSDTLTGFPMLVRLDSSTFDFSAADQQGDDIRFTKSDGSRLPFEIENWDPDSQTAVIWVMIDTLMSGNTEQYIIMNWGDSRAAGESNGAAVFDTAQGFTGVWHLNENPGAGIGAIKDRTVNGFNGTSGGAMTYANVSSGMIGKALMFDGADDYVAAGKPNVSGSYTISCWVYASSLDSARRFIWKEGSYTLWYDGYLKCIRAEHYTDSLAWRGIYQDKAHILPLDISTWYYLCATYDGDRIRLYINGEIKDSTQSIGDTPHLSSEPLLIGGPGNEHVRGVIDEVRIENTARSAEWIRLCYLNQKQNGSMTKFKR